MANLLRLTNLPYYQALKTGKKYLKVKVTMTVAVHYPTMYETLSPRRLMTLSQPKKNSVLNQHQMLMHATIKVMPLMMKMHPIGFLMYMKLDQWILSMNSALLLIESNS